MHYFALVKQYRVRWQIAAYLSMQSSVPGTPGLNWAIFPKRSLNFITKRCSKMLNLFSQKCRAVFYKTNPAEATTNLHAPYFKFYFLDFSVCSNGSFGSRARHTGIICRRHLQQFFKVSVKADFH